MSALMAASQVGFLEAVLKLKSFEMHLKDKSGLNAIQIALQAVLDLCDIKEGSKELDY